MKPFALALAVLISTSFALAVGEAAPSCGVLSDPVSDVTITRTGTPDRIGDADAIDLTRVDMTLDDATLRVTLAVRDLGAPAPPGVDGARYEVAWEQGGGERIARAMRTGSVWRFSDVAGARVVAVPGAVDLAANTVTIDVPIGDASGATLTEVRARALELVRVGRVVTSPRRDRAPNADLDAGRFYVGAMCLTAITGLGETCTVTRAPAEHDATGDPAAIRAVSFTAADDVVLADLRVDGLADDPETVDGRRWEIRWSNPRFDDDAETQVAFAERSGDRVEFGVAQGETTTATTGLLDPDAGMIRILVPRDRFRLVDGTKVTGLQASIFDRNGQIARQRDVEPHDEPASWVVAPSCDGAERQVCPIVVDRPGDARRLRTDDDVPENYDGLDLRAVGAVPAAEGMRVSVRVEDLAAADPPGADVVGWTISWLDGDRRVYAQAERSADGVVFRVGARAADGRAPAGPAFGGVATTGSLDLRAGLVSVDVPARATPQQGVVLDGVGATAWALTGRTTGATYLVWDTTGARTYRAGVVCEA